MKNRLGSILTLAMALTVLGGVGSAHADNKHKRYDSRDYDRYEREYRHDNGYHNGYHNGYRGHGYHGHGYKQRVVYITPHYQPRYQTIYYSPNYPYAVETRYQVGDYLPWHVRAYEPDRNIVAVLPPVYRGTRYVQVDDNVYLVSEATKQILNAVVLLSGVR